MRRTLFTVWMLLFAISLAGCGGQVVLETGTAARETEEGGGEKEPEAPGIFVHVCGAVASPGVYELPAGSRVLEAVEAAGGFAPGAAADYLNLAEVLSDGRKVTVPAEAELSPGEQYGPSEDEDGVVDINRAGKEELMTLPGIGEARAEAVIAYREEHGGFSSPEEIMKVPGIKEASYEKLKDKITAGP